MAPAKKTPTPFTDVIGHIVMMCSLPDDSTMVAYIRQQGWTKLVHVTSIDIEDVKDFHTVRSDGVFEAAPMRMHLRMFKCFLLYYRRKCRELSTTLTEDDVKDNMTRTELEDYCGSERYVADVAAGGTAQTTQGNGNPGGVVGTVDSLTVQEFRRGIKRDKMHYEELKDDKHFNSWNRGFVATARMHHTDLVLDETYVPSDAAETAVFKEMQIFMYAILEEKLKTDKGKSLISQYEAAHDAQSVYRELKKHALGSTAAQLSGDTLLQYITTTRYPGNWRGTSYAFVLHWKEQVTKV